MFVPHSQIDPSSQDQTLVPIEQTVEVPDTPGPSGVAASGNRAQVTAFDPTPSAQPTARMLPTPPNEGTSVAAQVARRYAAFAMR